MKQIHKNIILSAGLLFASAGLMAQTDVEKTDTLAQKVMWLSAQWTGRI